MTFIDICIINMSNNHELKRTFNCCDKKGGKGWGMIKIQLMIQWQNNISFYR